MNLNTLIVDDAGRDIYQFGGNQAWKTTAFRGYIVILEWFVGRQSTEPMLVVQACSQAGDAGAFGICLSSIGAYADPSGGPAPGALQLCRDALPMLGKNVLDMEARALLDVVLRFAPDLINMPPAPLAMRREKPNRPLIEVELRDESSGKTQHEVAL